MRRLCIAETRFANATIKLQFVFERMLTSQGIGADFSGTTIPGSSQRAYFTKLSNVVHSFGLVHLYLSTPV
jgi:hypothetical protein